MKSLEIDGNLTLDLESFSFRRPASALLSFPPWFIQM